jgi:hypothetical protein
MSRKNANAFKIGLFSRKLVAATRVIVIQVMPLS